MNTQPSAVRCSQPPAHAMAITGMYSRVAAVAASQMKEIAPVCAACLLNRFQLACATAAIRMSVIAVALTDGGSCRFCARVRARLAEPSRLLSREVWACSRATQPGRRFLAPLGPGCPALIVGGSWRARHGTLGAATCCG